jgi:hypothetical protein
MLILFEEIFIAFRVLCEGKEVKNPYAILWQAL